MPKKIFLLIVGKQRPRSMYKQMQKNLKFSDLVGCLVGCGEIRSRGLDLYFVAIWLTHLLSPTRFPDAVLLMFAQDVNYFKFAESITCPFLMLLKVCNLIDSEFGKVFNRDLLNSDPDHWSLGSRLKTCFFKFQPRFMCDSRNY